MRRLIWRRFVKPEDGAPGTVGEFAGVRVRERYGLVLIMLLGAYIVSGFGRGLLIGLLEALIWMTVLLTLLWSPGIPARLRRVGVVVTTGLVVAVVALTFSEGGATTGVALLLLGASQLLAVAAILARIAQHSHVESQTVMGAIAGYALIGFAMAALFHGLELTMEGAFLNGVVASGDYVYFSLITLTTVGYGDITAASDLAKRLVAVEALGGQIFLITLVARLVSMWGQPMRHSAD